MSEINWEQKIQIDREWVNRQLNIHFEERKLKITVRCYTPKVSGTQLLPLSLAQELVLMLPEYVLSEEKKLKIENEVKINFGEKNSVRNSERLITQISRDFFGKKDPQTDGKYGELLLFALVESILGCKMVAHKIKSLTNFKDQVKGGDGIFLGNYTLEGENKVPAYLIGESKITEQFSTAVDEAYKSLARFHDPEVQNEFLTTEFILAKENMIIDENIDELYNRLTPTNALFKSQVLVHPVLIFFNTKKIASCEKTATTPLELEQLIKEKLLKEKARYIESINTKIESYDSIQKVYVDFFIFPFNNIDSFRNTLYKVIHGISYGS